MRKLLPPDIFSFLFILFFAFLLFILACAYPVFPPGTDHAHHALLTQYILDQETLAISWPDGTPVNYPVLFHGITCLAVQGGIPLYRAGFIFSLTLLLGSIILFFVILRMYSQDAAYFGLFLLCFSPVLLKYQLMGLYPNVLGIFLYLLLLLILVKTELQSLKASTLCGVVAGCLILTHGIAAITGGIIIISFVTASYLFHRPAKKKYLIPLVAAAVLVSLPWSLRIVPILASGHHTLYAPARVIVPKSFVQSFVEDFGVLFFLAAGSVIVLRKRRYPQSFLATAIIWWVLLLLLSLTVWGHRFKMEAVLPAGILSGMVMAELTKHRYFLIVLMICVGVQTAGFSSLYIPSITHDSRLEMENLTAMIWTKDHTLEDTKFYFPVLLHPLYMEIVAQRVPVNAAARSSAEMEFFPFQADSRALAHPEVLGALLDRNSEYIYLSNRGALTFFNNQPFSSFAYLQQHFDIFTGVYACGRVMVYHIECSPPGKFSYI